MCLFSSQFELDRPLVEYAELCSGWRRLKRVLEAPLGQTVADTWILRLGGPDPESQITARVETFANASPKVEIELNSGGVYRDLGPYLAGLWQISGSPSLYLSELVRILGESRDPQIASNRLEFYFPAALNSPADSAAYRPTGSSGTPFGDKLLVVRRLANGYSVAAMCIARDLSGCMFQGRKRLDPVTGDTQLEIEPRPASLLRHVVYDVSFVPPDSSRKRLKRLSEIALADLASWQRFFPRLADVATY